LGTIRARTAATSYGRFDPCVEHDVADHAGSDPCLLRRRCSVVQAADDLNAPC